MYRNGQCMLVDFLGLLQFVFQELGSDRITARNEYIFRFFQQGWIVSFQFGADGKAGSGSPSAASGSSAREESAPRDEGEAIKYPDEEINPEDIPF